MAEPAVLLCTMPMLCFCRDCHHIARLQALDGFSFLLIPSFSIHADKKLPRHSAIRHKKLYGSSSFFETLLLPKYIKVHAVQQTVHLFQLLPVQHYPGRCGILPDTLRLCRTRNRDDPRLLTKHPCESLCRLHPPGGCIPLMRLKCPNA